MFRSLVLLLMLILLVACGDASAPTETPAPTRVDSPVPTPSLPSPIAEVVEVTGEATAPSTPTPISTAVPSSTAVMPPTSTPLPTPPVPLEVFINLEPVATGLAAPVALVSPEDGSGRLFVADQTGQLWVVTRDGNRLPTPMLDLSPRMVQLEPGYDERGLLGLALHPDFASSGAPGAGILYAYYSAPLLPGSPADFNHTGRVSSFRISAIDPNVVDPDSEQVVLEIAEPQFNHNGGQLAFGPDGYLYIGVGDGGAQYDFGPGHGPIGNAQDMSSLLGKILRLQVDPSEPGYTTPVDNPLVAAGGRPEVYATGFRNPYRFSFDVAGDGALYAADVGQDLFEELNIVVPGGNYGWRIREGLSCFNLNAPLSPLPDCLATDDRGQPMLDPVLVYDHSVGRSIIAGYVYRGTEITSLRGRYVFGDWQFDAAGLVLFSAVPTETGWVRSPLSIGAGTTGLSPLTYLLGFGQDTSGELYALTTESLGPTGTTGRVYRLVPARR